MDHPLTLRPVGRRPRSRAHGSISGHRWIVGLTLGGTLFCGGDSLASSGSWQSAWTAPGNTTTSPRTDQCTAPLVPGAERPESEGNFGCPPCKVSNRQLQVPHRSSSWDSSGRVPGRAHIDPDLGLGPTVLQVFAYGPQWSATSFAWQAEGEDQPSLITVFRQRVVRWSVDKDNNPVLMAASEPWLEPHIDRVYELDGDPSTHELLVESQYPGGGLIILDADTLVTRTQIFGGAGDRSTEYGWNVADLNSDGVQELLVREAVEDHVRDGDDNGWENSLRVISFNNFQGPRVGSRDMDNPTIVASSIDDTDGPANGHCDPSYDSYNTFMTGDFLVAGSDEPFKEIYITQGNCDTLYTLQESPQGDINLSYVGAVNGHRWYNLWGSYAHDITGTGSEDVITLGYDSSNSVEISAIDVDRLDPEVAGIYPSELPQALRWQYTYGQVGWNTPTPTRVKPVSLVSGFEASWDHLGNEKRPDVVAVYIENDGDGAGDGDGDSGTYGQDEERYLSAQSGLAPTWASDSQDLDCFQGTGTVLFHAEDGRPLVTLADQRPIRSLTVGIGDDRQSVLVTSGGGEVHTFTVTCDAQVPPTCPSPISLNEFPPGAEVSAGGSGCKLHLLWSTPGTAQVPLMWQTPMTLGSTGADESAALDLNGDGVGELLITRGNGEFWDLATLGITGQPTLLGTANDAGYITQMGRYTVTDAQGALQEVILLHYEDDNRKRKVVSLHATDEGGITAELEVDWFRPSLPDFYDYNAHFFTGFVDFDGTVEEGTQGTAEPLFCECGQVICLGSQCYFGDLEGAEIYHPVENSPQPEMLANLDGDHSIQNSTQGDWGDGGAELISHSVGTDGQDYLQVWDATCQRSGGIQSVKWFPLADSEPAPAGWSFDPSKGIEQGLFHTCSSNWSDPCPLDMAVVLTADGQVQENGGGHQVRFMGLPAEGSSTEMSLLTLTTEVCSTSEMSSLPNSIVTGDWVEGGLSRGPGHHHNRKPDGIVRGSRYQILVHNPNDNQEGVSDIPTAYGQAGYPLQMVVADFEPGQDPGVARPEAAVVGDHGADLDLWRIEGAPSSGPYKDNVDMAAYTYSEPSGIRNRTKPAASARIDARAGDDLVYSMSDGSLRAVSGIDGKPLWPAPFFLCDGRGSLDNRPCIGPRRPRLINSVLVMDVNADGRDDALAASADGCLYAVGLSHVQEDQIVVRPRVLWTFCPTSQAPMMLARAFDSNADGDLEILAIPSDGRAYLLDGRPDQISITFPTAGSEGACGLSGTVQVGGTVLGADKVRVYVDGIQQPSDITPQCGTASGVATCNWSTTVEVGTSSGSHIIMAASVTTMPAPEQTGQRVEVERSVTRQVWWSSDTVTDKDGDGFTVCDGDCDDSNLRIYPDAVDTQGDGVDQDCDGQTDEPDVEPTPAPIPEGQQDLDGDGVMSGDTEGDGQRLLDCDDSDARTYPGAPELCDGINNDCDDNTTEDYCATSTNDRDEDGSVENLDCDDLNHAVFPGAAEVVDGVDNNCDGIVDETILSDEDGDQWTVGRGDCDDQNVDIHPGANEWPDGRDNDCDGIVDDGSSTDDDGDLWSEAQGDCNDQNSEQHPGAEEIENGIDDDCDCYLDEPYGCVSTSGLDVLFGMFLPVWILRRRRWS